MRRIEHTTYEFTVPNGMTLTLRDKDAADWFDGVIRDAERYRWLRSDAAGGDIDRWIGFGSLGHEGLDAAIDAAIASAEKGKP